MTQGALGQEGRGDQGYYDQGAHIKLKPLYPILGYYPKNPKHLSSGEQSLTCDVATDEKFVDSRGNHATEYMECEKGCIDKDKLPTVGVREHVKILDYHGKTLSRCVSSETIRKEWVARTKINVKFLCSQNSSDKTDSQYYNDHCENACRMLQEPLPYGVKIIKVRRGWGRGDRALNFYFGGLDF